MDIKRAVDFYKGTAIEESVKEIYAETAVSMKTTIVTNVEKWLASEPVKENIKFLNQGLSTDGLLSNRKTMFITKAEIHIYMPKENATKELKTLWMNKLNSINPNIKFEINTIEDFIK